MTTVIKSNKAYTGNKTLPNIIDFATTTAERKSYLTDTYAKVSNDTSYITDANADSLFTKLTTHRNRVLADGGIVPSLAQTLRAIIFASTHGLTGTRFTALSADFGVKMDGSVVNKVYDLSGRDLEPLSGAFTKSTVGSLTNVSASVLSSLIHKGEKFAFTSGMILGSSSNDILSDATSRIRTPMIIPNSAGTGTAVAYIENNNGNLAKLSYMVANGTPVFLTTPQSEGNYNKYAGLVGLSIANGSSYLYENGVQKSQSASASKDLSETDTYLSAQISSAGSMLNESWVINSASQSLAVALSNHLNKAEFV